MRIDMELVLERGSEVSADTQLVKTIQQHNPTYICSPLALYTAFQLRLGAQMSLQVNFQVVAVTERLLAHDAAEGLLFLNRLMRMIVQGDVIFVIRITVLEDLDN